MSTYTIEFISGLKPAGSNDYPLLHAKHVAIDDNDTRLSSILSLDVYPKNTVTVSEAVDGIYVYSVPDELAFTLIKGKTYVVEWNGKTYSCVAKSLNDYFTYVGNVEYLAPIVNPVATAASVKLDTPTIRLETVEVEPDEPVEPDNPPVVEPDEPEEPPVEDDTDAPFAILYASVGGNFAFFYTGESGSHTVRIYTRSNSLLPEITSDDNGKILKARNGEWIVDELESVNAPIVEISATGNVQLTPDTYYVFNDVDSLHVTLTPVYDGKLHEYNFEFVPNENFTSLTITPTPKWACDPQIVPGKTHQVSIMRGIGVMVCA